MRIGEFVENNDLLEATENFIRSRFQFLKKVIPINYMFKTCKFNINFVVKYLF